MTETLSGMAGSCFVIHPVLPPDHDLRGGSAILFRPVDAMLDEAVGLAAAINLKVLFADHFKVTRVSPSHLLGSGARDEIAEQIKNLQPNLVIINHNLSPVQQRNLEKDWDVKVIDRTGLILEIFGARAKTAEGKIQVELAALQYQRSRLVRTWSHLERQRGGTSGIGGPGETQLEIDRRLIDDKLARLKRELEVIKERRVLERKGREKIPFKTVAIVGYTNAGKSSLFNQMTGSDVFAKDLLFATLDTTMRRLDLPQGRTVILSDTVGFISDLPTGLVAAFRATLEQLEHADVILHVRDITAPDFHAQKADVHKIMADLGIDADHDPRVIEVWNKIDKLSDEDHQMAVREARERDGRVVLVSAHEKTGLDDLKVRIESIVSSSHHQQVIRIPVMDGAAIAWIHAHAHVETTEVDDDMMIMHVEIDPVDWARFQDRFLKNFA